MLQPEWKLLCRKGSRDGAQQNLQQKPSKNHESCTRFPSASPSHSLHIIKTTKPGLRSPTVF